MSKENVKLVRRENCEYRVRLNFRASQEEEAGMMVIVKTLVEEMCPS
jgi:hypothetical protein